jgi:glutamate/aspartate transport system substrate-binding protein
MDLCARIVEAVKKNVGVPNLNVKYQVVTSANRIPLLQNGVIDIECGSTTNTEARQKQVEFAMSHFFTGTRFLVRKDSGIKTWDDLIDPAIFNLKYWMVPPYRDDGNHRHEKTDTGSPV